MSIGSALYTMIIGPLKLLFEVVYSLAYYVTHSSGLSIIALSMVMNVLLLPLYKRADAVQEEENQIQKRLKPVVDHIKKSFKGDEQYMILNTYYRQNHYKPIYALRSSISLLLQIPFFIAAYDFLSNEYTVISSSFGPITSLGSADHLLFGMNLLPILMTVINIISSIIYTKGQPFRQNIQLYIMALAFLVFLYDRPAGLVFYWTLNNLFSLIKNIFGKIRNSNTVLSIILSVAGIAGIVFLLVRPMATITMQIIASGAMLMLQIPFIYLRFLKDRFPVEEKGGETDNRLFYTEILFLIVFYGLFIPCHVIGTSPSEFIDTINPVDPMLYIGNTLLLVIGVFGVWFVIYYSLMKASIRKYIGYGLFILCVVAVFDYFGFGRSLGNMSNMLIYEEGMNYSGKEKIINLVAVSLVCVAAMLVIRFKRTAVSAVIVIMIIASSILSVRNFFDIRSDVKGALTEIREAKSNQAEIHLSRSGENVLVIILDRAANSFFPYLLHEKPELKEMYSGFTYYPNTMSYAGSTNFGIPAVYGGYEYTPEAMDERSDEYLVDKHNEAIRVMPVLFDENGFEVTVFDPCYANYKSPGELSVYDDYPEIRKYNTEAGMFGYDPLIIRDHMDLLNRNLFCYGVMKSAPVILQTILYNGGAYNSINRYESLFSLDDLVGVSSKAYVKQGFANSFSVLQNLKNITHISDDDPDQLLLLYNNSTHEPTLLQEPDYEMKANVDNFEYDTLMDYSREDGNGNRIHFETFEQISHYQINMASIQELGRWFDYLKENGVYDNTRIIIVADHGASRLNLIDGMIKDGVDLCVYNPLLLIKDFYSSGFSVDESFMTNADTITYAAKDLIEDPVNPFTGKRISNEEKYDGDQRIYVSGIISVKENNGKTFLYDKIYSVHDDVFDLGNWDLNVK